MAEQAGDRIDRYRLLEPIGEGAFGIVWMAEQREPIRRKVALKLLKAGLDSRQVLLRFEAERQALALMDHPCIAQVLDGGTTPAGRAFFVMELVRGVPITEFCDRVRLPTPDRLQLFRRVCDAIQHAHHKGVVHRDIKPTNVLVAQHGEEPVPKVIDFGVAKATTSKLTRESLFTGFGQLIGTPEYMAPEQTDLSGLDVDARTDVYSLGILLYELLTGALPFAKEELAGRGYEDILRAIREVDPPRPSTRASTHARGSALLTGRSCASSVKLSKLLAGDLDWIVLRALEKHPDRRYPTASALAADLERHLRHLPVQAGPPQLTYRLSRFLRRHRLLLASSSAILLSVLAATLLALRFASDLRSQETSTEFARQSLLDWIAVSQDQSPFRVLDEGTPNRAKLERLADRAQETFADRPMDEVELRKSLAATYWRLGQFDRGTWAPGTGGGRRYLIAGDLNGASDVFLHEVASGMTTRVSEGTGGIEANGNSFASALDEDGSPLERLPAHLSMWKADRRYRLRPAKTAKAARPSVAAECWNWAKGREAAPWHDHEHAARIRPPAGWKSIGHNSPPPLLHRHGREARTGR